MVSDIGKGTGEEGGGKIGNRFHNLARGRSENRNLSGQSNGKMRFSLEAVSYRPGVFFEAAFFGRIHPCNLY